MKSEAYLSSSFFDGFIHKSNILPISLIAYEKLYIHIDLDKIPWNYAKFLTTSHKNPSALEDFKRFQNEELDLAAFTLANLLECNSKVLTELSSSLLDIREHPSKDIREFFDISITQPLRKERVTPVFHGELLMIIMEYLHRLDGYNLDSIIDQSSVLVAVQEFFVTHYLSTYHNISPIFNSFDIFIQKIINLLPPTPINFLNINPANTRLYHRFCDLEMIQDMVSLENKNIPVEDIQLLMDISVPDLMRFR